jgi:hypothetical protein
MGLLAFALNVTLDGCCDHREMIADDVLVPAPVDRRKMPSTWKRKVA